MITFDKKGETPLDDISGLKINITTRAELDEAEADNILEAYLKYTASPEQLDDVHFDVPFLQKLHKEMLGNVWTWAGEFRTTLTSIGVEAKNIRQRLYQLMDDLKYWDGEGQWDYQDIAVRLHFTLVQIHPFSNGNGRCGRLFTDIWLLSKGKEMLEWGDEDLVEANKTRTEYITALQEAEQGSYDRLKNFMFP